MTKPELGPGLYVTRRTDGREGYVHSVGKSPDGEPMALVAMDYLTTNQRVTVRNEYIRRSDLEVN